MLPTGDILNIDLTRNSWTRQRFPAAAIRTFIGGRGFNVAYLYKYLPEDADPLGPENILLLSCGLLTGSAAPASARLHVNALSPQTGLIGSSNVGGYFGASLRANGIVSLIVSGRSPKPVMILIRGGGIELRDAADLWGLDTIACQRQLQRRFKDERIRVMTIGPGGEKRVPFACLMTDLDHAAGRTGMGAVMGAKNLKAIVLGAPEANWRVKATPQAKAAVRTYVRQIRKSAEYDTFFRYGGAGYLHWANERQLMPTHNYQDSRFEGIDRLDGRRLAAHRTRSRGCHRCPIQCKAELHIQKGRYAGFRGARPEFEPVMILGAKCGLDDLEGVVVLDNLCARLGLDSLSAGSVIAFAMDLFQRGIITATDTGGLDLHWGDAAVMETLLHQIAERRGFGAVLAQGVRAAAEQIGRGAAAHAAHVKGLELTAYHPVSVLGTALGYAIANRGGDYVYAAMEQRWNGDRARNEFGSEAAVDPKRPEGKGLIVQRAVAINNVLDSLGLCRVPVLSCLGAFDLVAEAGLAAALCGLPFDAPMLLDAGGRIATLERQFNIQRGMTSEDDRIPQMFFDQPDSPLTTEVMADMVKQYYQAMGWDEMGQPTAGTLSQIETDIAHSTI